MLLVLTNSDDQTANYLCSRLAEEAPEIALLRLNTDTCSTELEVSYDKNGPRIAAHNRLVKPDDISTIWFRRPTAIKISCRDDTASSRQIASEWAEAIEGFLAHVPLARWINHPANNALASHKLEQLTRAANLGFLVPRSIVTQSPERLLAFAAEVEGELIAKPLASGFLEHSDGTNGIVYTSLVKPQDLNKVTLLKNCPTLFQEKINKREDVRICVVDAEIHAASMAPFNPQEPIPLDIRRDNMTGIDHRPITVPKEIMSKILEFVRSYQLRFAAIDMAVTTEGRWFFFELNPNGQWAWLDLIGGFNVAGSLISAFLRDI